MDLTQGWDFWPWMLAQILLYFFIQTIFNYGRLTLQLGQEGNIYISQPLYICTKKIYNKYCSVQNCTWLTRHNIGLWSWRNLENHALSSLIVTRLPPTSRSVTINAKTTVHCSPGSSMVCGPCLYLQNSLVERGNKGAKKTWTNMICQ